MNEQDCYIKETAECIKRKAYELWEQDGGKKGCALHYLLKAEKAVQSQNKEGSNVC